MTQRRVWRTALCVSAAFSGFLLAGLSPRAVAQTAPDLTASAAPDNALWLDQLDVSAATQGYGNPAKGRTVDGHPLTLAGIVYSHGFGTHAEGALRIALHGKATHFTSMVGVDDETSGKGSVTFTVLVDGKKAAETGVLHGGDKPQLLSVDLTGAQHLVLKVGDGGDGNAYDHADWAGAQIATEPGTPQAAVTTETIPIVPPRIVIPADDPHPAIHGARVVGTTPGRPFLFKVPATGTGPLTFTAKKLPAGLTLDPRTGIISGTVGKAGETRVTLGVKGSHGTATRTLTIVAGPHKLAQTPPMGWNSWNVWAGNVDSGKVRDAADVMISSGLAGHGYGYVNIDDTWEAGRDAQGNIQSNSKFPDMKALTDYIHSKGLKTGIYSSPGPTTCGGYTASYQHEDQDAASYAKWGFDYLKYDWCSYGNIAPNPSLDEMKKPYTVMAASLDKTNRDILFSYCQYGMGDVWKWGAQTGGNCWRTTGDINDSWGRLSDIIESQNGHEVYAGPGHWNDPDMLEVGYVGFGNPHPSHLTPNEQILHMTMWCILSAPLLIGCDMTRLDRFTLALLTNDEALDVNQDPLGKPAGRKSKTGDAEVWARPLADGTTAVALTNMGDTDHLVTADWSALGLIGNRPVRDLWLHKSAGSFDKSYSVMVPAHGAVLVKIGTPEYHTARNIPSLFSQRRVSKRARVPSTLRPHGNG